MLFKKNSSNLNLFLFYSFLFTSSVSLADDCDPIRKQISELGPKGGQVSIAKGFYSCSKPIIIDKSNIELIGAGQELVTIQLKNNIHAPLLIIGNARTIVNSSGNYVTEHQVENIKVSGITFDGNRDNHDTSRECGEGKCDGDAHAVRNNGITIRGASDVVIANVTTHSMISGGLVTEKYCNRLKVQNFNSYNNFFDGFAGYETENSEFTNLYLHDNKGAGISIDINFNNNVISNSKLEKNGDVGIFARNLRGNKFIDLSIQHSGNHGVFMAKAEGENSCSEDNEFRDVKINFSKRSGFRLNDDCKGNRLTGISNLCWNQEGAISESHPGSLSIEKMATCIADSF